MLRVPVAVDNIAIARVLNEIGDLLEIKGENPFKIRAYRNAAETIAHEPRSSAATTPAERLGLQGIGKDLAAKIGELAETGADCLPSGTLRQFPSTILDLLHLRVWAETVARSTASWPFVARAGAGARRPHPGDSAWHQERSAHPEGAGRAARFSGRRLVSEAHDAAVGLSHSRARARAEISVVGSLRRGCETRRPTSPRWRSGVTDGGLHELPAGRAGPRPWRLEVERAAVGSLRRTCVSFRVSLGAAHFYGVKSPQHRLARSR